MESFIPPPTKAIIGMATSYSFLSVTIRYEEQYFQNVVLSFEALHTGGRVYKVLKSTYLGELKGCERSFQGKKQRIEDRGDWPRRKEPREEGTNENKHVS